MITLREAVAGLVQTPEETWKNLPIVKQGLMSLAQELLEYECGITVTTYMHSCQNRSRRIAMVIEFGYKLNKRTVTIDAYALSDQYGVITDIDYFMNLGSKTGSQVIGNMDMIRTKLGTFMSEQGLAEPRRPHLFHQLWFKPEIKEITL